MSSIDPKQSEYFLAAVNAGSIRGAAETLNVEPSTISRQITALEEQFSSVFIERGRRGVCLTDAGQALLSYLRSQQSELEALKSEFDAHRGLRQGKISIIVGEGFVGDFVGTALSSFTKQYPGLTYAIHTGSTDQVVHDVCADVAHLGLAYNVSPSAQIKVLANMRQPLVLLAAPNSAFSDIPDPVPLDLLARLPCAVLKGGFGVSAIVNRIEMHHGIRLNAVVETTSIAVLKNFVRFGIGVALLPQFVVIREVMDRQIICRNLSIAEIEHGEAHLITRQGRKLPQAASKLGLHLKHAMKAYSKA